MLTQVTLKRASSLHGLKGTTSTEACTRSKLAVQNI